MARGVRRGVSLAARVGAVHRHAAGGARARGGRRVSDTPRLPRNVKALGVVSLLTDLSSEMIYPLLPLFLTTVLGAGASVSTSAFLKLASGWWSDRLPHRKPLVVVGYTLAAVARPLVGVATAAWHVLGIRLTDRAGKGIRSSPRDALLADSTHTSQRRRAD